MGDAADQARQMVAAAQDDPARRLGLAADFYEDKPYRDSIRSYRRAELSFIEWQMRRGVLAPTTDSRPGSRWWRAVNARLLCDTCEADLLSAGTPGRAGTPAVTRWTEFLDRPTPRSWYRAHNTSIAAAYVEYRELTEDELPIEKFFIDVTLARVLFVHSMIMNPRLALGGFFWPVGRIAGDPRSRVVDGYLAVRDVLPDYYPLTGRQLDEVLRAENFIGRLIDYGILLTRVQDLYSFAAEDLDEPSLLDFIEHGNPVYAWSGDVEAWSPVTSPRLIALLARLTAPA